MQRNYIEDTERNQVSFAKIVLIMLGIIGYAFVTFYVLKVVFAMIS